MQVAQGVVVGIGANLPDAEGRSPLEICCWAVEELARIPGLRLCAVSPWYETEPMPPSGQPSYINGVALLEGGADPATLLARLQEIESRGGRVRSVPNAARTLDLDIVAMGGLVRHGPDPVVPHPRMQDRLFVLLPLNDVLPGWVHPVLGQTPAQLAAALPQAGARRLGP